MKSPFEFKMIENTHIVDLKSKLKNLFHYIDNRIVAKIEYRSSKIDNDGKMKMQMHELCRVYFTVRVLSRWMRHLRDQLTYSKNDEMSLTIYW